MFSPANIKYKHLSSYLNEDNVDRAVKLRGLPFRVNAFDVVKFFHEEGGEAFKYISTSDIVIDFRDGKPTGFGLVFLKDEEDAETAQADLDHKYIGQRWIGISAAEMRS